MKELRLISPQGMLGYGYPISSLKRGLSYFPHFIGVDAGSTDAGPYRLGSGKPTARPHAVKRDLKPLLCACISRGIPLVIGSAGGAGAKEHVEWTYKILEEVAKEEKLSFKLAIIWADVEKEWLINKLSLGEVKPLGPVAELTIDEVLSAERIVAVMGISPYIEAFENGAQVILAGRSNDPAIFASFAIWKGFDYGLCFHLGKVLECGAMACVPGSASDGMLGVIKDDHFDLEPLNPKRKCTKLSVAAHTLYEKSNPFYIPSPEGELNLEKASFEQISERKVRVKGSLFKPAKECWIKLEGAKLQAYRCIFIAGIRDPIMIERISECEEATKEALAHYLGSEEYRVLFHYYGKNAVMGDLEPKKSVCCHELGLIFEAVAKTQELANDICSFVRSFLMHYHYQGRKATAGNLAFLYSPSDIPMGPVYVFNIHHLVKVKTPLEPFKMEVISIK